MRIYALVTTSCGNCPAVKKYLREHVTEHNVRIINETHQDFLSICRQFNATQAPTVLLVDDDGKEVWRASDVEELQELLK